MAKNDEDGLMTSVKWLEANEMADVVKKIRKLEASWAENNIKTRRCWKRVLLGTTNGEGAKLSLAHRGSDLVELPSLLGNKKFVKEVWGGPENLPDEYSGNGKEKPKAKKEKKVEEPVAEKKSEEKKSARVKKVEEATVDEAPKKRRGRPPKNPQAVATDAPPKRRGRPPKNKEADAAPATKSEPEDEKKAEVKDKVKQHLVEKKVKDKEKKEEGPSVSSALTKEWQSEDEIAKAIGKTPRFVHHELMFMEQKGFAVGQNKKDGSGMEWRQV